MNQLVLWACLIAGAVGSVRWLRVAQREHYGVGRTSRFARRWWLADTPNRLLAAIAALGVVASGAFWWAPLVTAAATAVGPIGLGLRGRTSSLAWTRRLSTTAVALALVAFVVVGLGALAGLGAAVLAVLLFGLPLWVDVALFVVSPLEALLSRSWVLQASDRLDAIDPVRVAITGSFGKTTIKGYVRHLVEGTRSVVATPASFNNTAGLCRSVNEHLPVGTEVFIAEMGTFAVGEIAAMTRWVRPSVSILAAIGPVHLERFGSLDRIVAAKSEIFATSRTAILNVDAYGLADEADRLAASGLRVIRCSAADPEADVAVLAVLAGDDRGDGGGGGGDGPRFSVSVFGREIASFPLGLASAANVACAVAAASALGVSDEDIASRLDRLPTPAHRRTTERSDSGVQVIDDTYNSNPAGASAALELLGATDAGRRVVVTPGMVELGRTQTEANRAFGAQAATVADDLLVVGRTNRTALVAGATGWEIARTRKALRGRAARDFEHAPAAADGSPDADGGHKATVRCVANRDDAVHWVRENLASGDAVLYENDLPDHYP